MVILWETIRLIIILVSGASTSNRDTQKEGQASYFTQPEVAGIVELQFQDLFDPSICDTFIWSTN